MKKTQKEIDEKAKAILGKSNETGEFKTWIPGVKITQVGKIITIDCHCGMHIEVTVGGL